MDRTEATTLTADPTAIPITVTLVGAEGESLYHDRMIHPTTTARDITIDLGLRGYYLRNPESRAAFAPTDDVYAVMHRLQQQGQFPKLEAVPDMQVAQEVAPAGATIPPSLVAAVVRHAVPLVTPRPPASPPAVDRARFAAVTRAKPDYWREAGWQEVAPGCWRGRYVIPQGSWAGEIRQVSPHECRPAIIDPPAEVAAHPHAGCLGRPGPDGRRWLHFSRVPTSVSGAVIAFEVFLAESFAAARRGGRG